MRKSSNNIVLNKVRQLKAVMLEDGQLDEQGTVVYVMMFMLAWNDWNIVKNELESTWKEAVVA